MELFSKLSLENWRQFESVEIDFHSQTTILTGANGCGKTTILNVLSRHFGWNLNFISTPFIGKKKKKKIFSDLRRVRENEEISNEAEKVGAITYGDNSVCHLLVPPNQGENPQYALQYSAQKPVVGLHIPSHRPAITFQRVDQLPANPKNNQQQYQEFQQLLLQTYGSTNVRNPGLVLKQSLISMAMFGYGNEAVQEVHEYRTLFEEFQNILRILMPDNIGFERIEVRMPDVVLITRTGEFSLDAMSGGVNSIFGIAWQIHMYGADKEQCTVIIDEPENHLHPSMQRTLIPKLEKAFPRYRFIIATHSPFIVTSNPNANVYSLNYNEGNRIKSDHLDSADLASSPERVLTEILEVPTTLPVWVEDKISDILDKHQGADNSVEDLEKLFLELQESGVSDALSKLPPSKKVG